MRITTYWLLGNICTEGSYMTDQVVLAGLICQAISLSMFDTSDVRKELVWLLAKCSPYLLPQS